MNLKYMMLKDRYKFTYGPQLPLYDASENDKRTRAISLYLKELSLYGIGLRNLSKHKIPANIKNELLNIAFACAEENLLYNEIRKLHTLPIKQLSTFTYKSKVFIEKWQDYIIAYFILITNKNYKSILGYLNIESKQESNYSKSEVQSIVTLESSSITILGLALKVINRTTFALTPYGDFIRLNVDDSIDVKPGISVSGTIKKDLSFYKYPLIASTIGFIIVACILMYFYIKPSRTVIIVANSTIKISVNSLDRTVEVDSLSANGSKITESLGLFNKSMDESIYSILKTAREKKIIDEKKQISIYISGSKIIAPNLIKTGGYVSEYNLKVVVNNNGIEHKLHKIDKN
jgi:hypothetical protein